MSEQKRIEENKGTYEDDQGARRNPAFPLVQSATECLRRLSRAWLASQHLDYHSRRCEKKTSAHGIRTANERCKTDGKTENSLKPAVKIQAYFDKMRLHRARF